MNSAGSAGGRLLRDVRHHRREHLLAVELPERPDARLAVELLREEPDGVGRRAGRHAQLRVRRDVLAEVYGGRYGVAYGAMI